MQGPELRLHAEKGKIVIAQSAMDVLTSLTSDDWPCPAWTGIPGALLAVLTAVSVGVEVREWAARQRRRALEMVIREVRAGLRRRVA